MQGKIYIRLDNQMAERLNHSHKTDETYHSGDRADLQRVVFIKVTGLQLYF